MPRYKLLIEYDGTNYSGWQIQPNADTVEERLEQALTRIIGESIDLIGQGRTDAGVHAEAQAAHCDIEKAINRDDLLYALLGVLPRDIAVWDVQKVQDDFHARFDAKFRQYRYQFIRRPSPLLQHTATLIRDNLNWNAMHRCAKMIEGTHDFTSFSKAGDNRTDAVCRVGQSLLQRDGFRITYRIRANRFVHHMVRRLAGSMLQVGKGKWSIDRFQAMLHQPDDENKAHGIKAKGLILEKVEY